MNQRFNRRPIRSYVFLGLIIALCVGIPCTGLSLTIYHSLPASTPPEVQEILDREGMLSEYAIPWGAWDLVVKSEGIDNNHPASWDCHRLLIMLFLREEGMNCHPETNGDFTITAKDGREFRFQTAAAGTYYWQGTFGAESTDGRFADECKFSQQDDKFTLECWCTLLSVNSGTTKMLVYKPYLWPIDEQQSQ